LKQNESLREVFANPISRGEYVKRATGGLRSSVWAKKGSWSEPAIVESYGPVLTPEIDDQGNQEEDKGVAKAEKEGGYYPVRKLLSPVSSTQLEQWQASLHQDDT